jgi:hypothetical protein
MAWRTRKLRPCHHEVVLDLALTTHRHRRNPSRIFVLQTESGRSDFVNTLIRAAVQISQASSDQRMPCVGDDQDFHEGTLLRVTYWDWRKVCHCHYDKLKRRGTVVFACYARAGSWGALTIYASVWGSSVTLLHAAGLFNALY